LLLAVGVAVASACLGAVAVAPLQVIAILADQLHVALPWAYAPQQESVMVAIRLPRIMLGAVVGAALALAGVAMQGTYRSQLADPALIGVGTAAALGAATCSIVALMVVGSTTTFLAGVAIAAAGMGSAVLGGAVIYRVASATGRTVVAAMLLAGIALVAILSAIIGFLTLAVRDPQLHDLTFWTLGGLTGASWRGVLVVGIVAIVAGGLVARRADALDAIALGESEASHLGFDVVKERRVAIVLVAALVGTAVAFAGVIAFVAVLAPFLVRRMLGARHGGVVVGSALLGAALVMVADDVARTIVLPAELPLGMVTAAFGGPVFLSLLVRDRTAIAA
jgi:iron complex transport system permease protein